MAESASIALRRFSRTRTGDEEQQNTSTVASEMVLKQSPTNLVDRWLRKGKRRVGISESLKAVAFSSWLNILIIFIPIAWVAHFYNEKDPEHPEETFPYVLTFIMCFLAIIPLEKLFDYCGEQMAFYLGEDLGELLVITLNNTVEATLAIILLKKCELRLLQSTIIGVVVLHLLLVPGVAFVTGGARIVEQDLHPHITQLNQSLLTIGVLTLLLPASFFAALDRGVIPVNAEQLAESLVNDTTRRMLLQMSRGLAFILLGVYVCSRIFLHNPPGENVTLADHKLAPEALRDRAKEREEQEPEVNQYVCIAIIAITVGIMAATAEWLVDSIEFVREAGGIQEEFFGLVVLPLVSFSGDGFLAILFFLRSWIQYFRGIHAPPGQLANARPIDLSIQFILFWMPFIVLLGWWTDRPMSLLFDLFEVALLIGACFIVNYVTADAKTNWAEGFAMLSFYFMIALCTWFYSGQEQVHLLLGTACKSVLETVMLGPETVE
ncbi:Sodium calcium exchanger [Mycena indigotica]|uniref:Sodium calcium exchanger n=1 Tax=Mycena indigotica TaxID=2126181 RepID=A0A8H6W4J5_9AGAR|nr:Sodium calcium exchanger [Mycena indigotica]KAF7301533.1 Sodium calcium exchanger [Mycena indigotica]